MLSQHIVTCTCMCEEWRCKSVDAAKEDDSLGRLVNDDNIEPNSRIRTITVEGQPHLCLLAIKDIRPGEEITYNDDWPWRSKISTETEGQAAVLIGYC
ncbi:N-lysine methyltransferase KMT5A-A-like [Perca fluviatilis]|uniref:N-lysine methyltransferase KMT5A-A-like n=1 Tax=Perca fluviatilis TaxID=8168 RepID=UPI001966B3B1|nr:N-lysine methyltransferase KMT5A-A-like [Perca fluviatilis]